MEFTYQLVTSMIMFAIASSITPGPNNMMLLSSGVNFGFQKTLPHLLGIVLGHYVMLILVASGIAQIFESMPLLYQAMKIAGLTYLLYLAWSVANSGAPTKSAKDKSKPLSFIGAALFQWVNPKAWLVAVTYSTNYIPPAAPFMSIVVACLLYSVFIIPTGGSWLLLGIQLEHYLQNQKIRRIFNWVMAVLLVVSMLPVLFMV